ncbi:MAG: malto-oligosyltrehalose trehalohydrolase, partial [Verrucomicrobiota bacterium]
MARAKPLSHSCAFEVWAPNCQTLDVISSSGQITPLERSSSGHFDGEVSGLSVGDSYHFRLDGDQLRPDPESRFQPQGVHGPSQIVDPLAYAWRDAQWKGISKESLIVYELHIGTFSPEGTYEGALARLDHICALGATAIELLPLAQTPGRWNWGYDGVNLFAPNHHYGTPEELRKFVDQCHSRGLAVILDVVYNHLGPEGNYLACYGPYHSRKHKTPWGPALNFDGNQSGPVREYICQNALYWLEEFHFDGLRLDAIRLMFDDSEHHIVHEIAARVSEFAATKSYPIHLIAEANVFDQDLLTPPQTGAGYDLLWNDEFTHSFQALTVGQAQVDSRVYQGANDLEETLNRGYLYQREADGRSISRTSTPDQGPLSSLLQGLQTHDQIGNHPEGLRLHQIASTRIQMAGAALFFLHPGIPLLFMGEEFAAPSPFCFFVDFGDEGIRKAVVEGRKRDYEHHNWTRFVSPLAETTFLSSKLVPVSSGDAVMLAWYQDLIRLRKAWQQEGLLQESSLAVGCDPEKSFFHLSYEESHHVFVNLGDEP